MPSPLVTPPQPDLESSVLTSSPSKLSPPTTSLWRRWSPALLAVAAAVAINAVSLKEVAKGVQPSQHFSSSEDVQAHTEAVFGADRAWSNRELFSSSLNSSFGADSSASSPKKNWFNDAKVPVGSVPASAVRSARNRYSMRRSYADPVTASSESRALYEAHVDVADQFTTFGKIFIGVTYFAFWVFLMFPDWFLPIGRPGIALGGGMTMIIFRYILLVSGQGPPFDAEGVIILEPLFLLFGLMLTTIYLEKMERGGLFDKLRASLDDPVPWKRCFKIMMMSTVGSAAVMNDSIVLIFSAVVVDLCVKHKVSNSLPYLLGLATTANIGSALTMTGNPQNILIAALSYDELHWLNFAANMLLPVVFGTWYNTTLMMIYYKAELFPGNTGVVNALLMMINGHRTPEMVELENEYYVRKSESNEVELPPGLTMWGKIQVAIVIGFLACFAGGLDISTTVITTGCVLMLVTSWKRRDFDSKEVPLDENGEVIPAKKTYDVDGNEIEAEPETILDESETTLTEVDYGLLLLFIGQFILIGSFDDTGIPQAFFAISMGGCADNMTDSPCVYWLVTIVVLLSNVASNVPICQMLAATFPYATPYDWMQVSFSATIGGNLTMLGSAANMIVAFQAAKVGDRTFTSERHAPFGIPSTCGVLYAGTFIMNYINFAPHCSERLGTCEQEAANDDGGGND